MGAVAVCPRAAAIRPPLDPFVAERPAERCADRECGALQRRRWEREPDGGEVRFGDDGEPERAG